MTRILPIKSVPAFIAVLALVTPCVAEELPMRMDAIVQSYADAKQFMGSVLVAREDKVIFSKGYGFANLEWNTPNSPTTKFRLGSVTKQFTAACVLLLEERGKLKLDEPIKKYFPDVPAAWEKITIFHLLTHTAGIADYTGFSDYSSLQPFPTTVEKLIQRFRNKPLEFEPGERMKYSSSGYVLLGALIEKISGATYEAFLQENIFAPLGMKDSGYDSNTVIISQRAHGYSRSANGLVNAGFTHMSIPYAAGALYSTTEDLLRWERALFGTKLLSSASLIKMTTPFKENYALGLRIEENFGRKVIQHGGNIDGFNAALAYYPGTQTTVVVLANISGSAAGEIAGKLGALTQAEPAQLKSERKEIKLSPDMLSQYAGTYSLAPKINMMIRVESGRLTAQQSGQGRGLLFADSENTFFARNVDAQFEFIRDASHVVTRFVLHQGGRDRIAPRISDTVTERREISLPVERLTQFVGTYELPSGLDIAITLEDDQLMSQPTHGRKEPLFAESDGIFFSKLIDVQIEFERDKNGVVTGFILHQGASDTRAGKK